MLPFRSHIVPLSPAFVVAAANAFIGVSEEGEAGGDAGGRMVETYLRRVRLTSGQPWCAAFVHHVGYSAHFDHATGRSSWPLPATGSCDTLARTARAHGVLRHEPYVGDVFLLYSRARGRFIHSGIVVSVRDEERVHERNVHVCVTVEGNANDEWSNHGHTARRQVRTFREADGHRFVRWAEMEQRVAAA